MEENKYEKLHVLVLNRLDAKHIFKMPQMPLWENNNYTQN
jgi:hypothetical protein